MSKAKELREMTTEQLQFALREAQAEWFQLRVKSTTEKVDVHSAIRKTRREIARLQTILRQRELAGGKS
ncbi:MAG: 50S ribosomal protein L29 [Planctomycetaceae bacterium]